MEKRKTWWLLLSVAIVNVVGGIVVQALVWIGPVFRSQSSAVGQWLLLWNMVQGLLVVISGYLGVSAYLKEQRKATRATAVELFDHTIDAIQYFNEEVVPAVDQVLASYQDSPKSGQEIDLRRKTRQLILLRKIREGHFEKIFRKLNVLSGYVHYGMVNEPQLYASIWDEVSRMTQLRDYQLIRSEYERQFLMNNYLDFLDELEAYAKVTELRRKSK
jgi:hypothetical protein